MSSDDMSSRRGETCKALKVYEEKLGDFQCKLDAIVSVSGSLQDLSMKMNDVQAICDCLSSEKINFEEFWAKSRETTKGDDSLVGMAEEFEEIKDLFDVVMKQAVDRKVSLEKVFEDQQEIENSIDSIQKIVDDVKRVSSCEGGGMDDEELKQHFEMLKAIGDLLESQSEAIEVLKRKQKESCEDVLKTSRLSQLLKEYESAWNNVKDRKTEVIREIKSRESRGKTLNDCVQTVEENILLLQKDFATCLNKSEMEKIGKTLANLRDCIAVLKDFRSEFDVEESENVSTPHYQGKLNGLIDQCITTENGLSSKLSKLEMVLKRMEEFYEEVDEVNSWMVETKDIVLVDFYCLTEEERETVALKHENLAKEFYIMKEKVDNLVKFGSELKCMNSAEFVDEIEYKMTKVLEMWRKLEQVFTSQEEHIEECLCQHKSYYDTVEQFWDWVQTIGERMSGEVEESEHEDNLLTYLSIWNETKVKADLFDDVLSFGQRLSEKLPQGDASEINEQLERLKYEWYFLNSQVLERLKELNEIMDEATWSRVVHESGVIMEDLDRGLRENFGLALICGESTASEETEKPKDTNDYENDGVLHVNGVLNKTVDGEGEDICNNNGNGIFENDSKNATNAAEDDRNEIEYAANESDADRNKTTNVENETEDAENEIEYAGNEAEDTRNESEDAKYDVETSFKNTFSRFLTFSVKLKSI
ncbi:spectrin alpha chain, non-erythrocytic 1-like [Xenia sp. Carnegie-2017]|uniref:spectrin alpha chain, non-erythrocytic 1-like n=1 Tax=Xenia sp. Carnegie-2017 TaxID=2897299 RepID=UPI001F03FA30|nr:spectrin alpha chain, non-erythrocytic 1-like [Xenia sp. Carnegie-2017]